jgi:uncharacterized protein YjbI with pentapeptide repeats
MTPPDEHELTACEQGLRRAALAGVVLDLRAGDAGKDDPTIGNEWGAERTLRANVLYQHLVSERPGRAVVIRGARISGALNLAAATIRCPVILEGCSFDGPVNLSEATVESVCLNGCRLTCVQAAQLRTRGDFQLRRSVAAVVGLQGAHIGGNLRLDAATLIGGSWPPELAGATLHPFVDVGDDQERLAGVALVADELQVDGEMLIRSGFRASGEVRLIGARVRGQLNLNGAHLRNKTGRALNADRLTVEGSMFFQEGFIAEGEVRLIGVRVHGQLNLTGARLTCSIGSALNAAHADIGGSMLCRDLVAVGELRFLGAAIHGQLNLNGARLSNASGSVLNAARVEIGGSMLCRELVASGELRFLGARIRDQVNFDGARLISTTGKALTADRLTVDGSAFFQKGFIAEGEVRLVGARIAGQLSFDGATLVNPDGNALALQESQVQGSLRLLFSVSPDGTVDLRGARSVVLIDHEQAWPRDLRLAGFTYDQLLARPDVSVKVRLRWIRHDTDGYSPQPYEQLSAYYRRSGHEPYARTVAIAKQRHRRETLRPPGRLGSLLFGAAVGYGYRAWLAGVWLVVAWAIGSVLMATAFPEDFRAAKPKAEIPDFQPALYSLDLLLPIVNLRQQDAWIAEGPAQWGAVLTILGWVLATAAIAAVTGVLKKD